MGMFDYLYVQDPAVLEKLKCAHGHPASNKTEWQTKDLDCGMDSLFIVGGHLHRVMGDWLADETLPEAPPPPGDALEYTGQVRFYSNCEQCPETFWIRDPEDQGCIGFPQRTRPWTEYIALFVKGKLLHLEPVELETCEEDAEKMKVNGWIQTDSKGNPL